MWDKWTSSEMLKCCCKSGRDTQARMADASYANAVTASRIMAALRDSICTAPAFQWHDGLTQQIAPAEVLPPNHERRGDYLYERFRINDDVTLVLPHYRPLVRTWMGECVVG